jgi:hypothetical protein
MLGGSLAAQPEHETISVNRMLDHLPSLNGFLGIWLYHTGRKQLRMPIGIANYSPLGWTLFSSQVTQLIVIGTWQLAIGNRQSAIGND